MGDRVFFLALGCLVAAMIALALVWPQGLGRPSPRPFGHPLAPLGAPPGRPAAPGPGANGVRAPSPDPR
jgi:hypothetical protein